MSCSYHREIKGRLNASQIAYKIHKQLLPLLTTFFHASTSLPSRCKLNILTGATGFSAHIDVPQHRTAPLPESYSTTLPPQTTHSNHIMLAQKHLFLVLLHFCLTTQILNKTRKVHKSCLSLEFATSTAPNLQDQTPLQRQPRHSINTCQNPLSYGKTNPMEEANKYLSHRELLHRTPSPCEPPKDNGHAASEPSAWENGDTGTLGAVEGNSDRATLGAMEGWGDGTRPRGFWFF